MAYVPIIQPPDPGSPWEGLQTVGGLLLKYLDTMADKKYKESLAAHYQNVTDLTRLEKMIEIGGPDALRTEHGEQMIARAFNLPPDQLPKDPKTGKLMISAEKDWKAEIAKAKVEAAKKFDVWNNLSPEEGKKLVLSEMGVLKARGEEAGVRKAEAEADIAPDMLAQQLQNLKSQGKLTDAQVKEILTLMGPRAASLSASAYASTMQGRTAEAELKAGAPEARVKLAEQQAQHYATEDYKTLALTPYFKDLYSAQSQAALADAAKEFSDATNGELKVSSTPVSLGPGKGYGLPTHNTKTKEGGVIPLPQGVVPIAEQLSEDKVVGKFWTLVDNPKSPLYRVNPEAMNKDEARVVAAYLKSNGRKAEVVLAEKTGMLRQDRYKVVTENHVGQKIEIGPTSIPGGKVEIQIENELESEARKRIWGAQP
jgi:hypothetical protein